MTTEDNLRCKRYMGNHFSIKGVQMGTVYLICLKMVYKKARSLRPSGGASPYKTVSSE